MLDRRKKYHLDEVFLDTTPLLTHTTDGQRFALNAHPMCCQRTQLASSLLTFLTAL